MRAGTVAFLVGLAPAVGISLLAFRVVFSFEALLISLIVVRVLIDGLAANSAWSKLGPEFRSGRWDLLRLTAQSEGTLLRAHYAAAHAGVWRVLMFCLGMQSGIVLAVTLFHGNQQLQIWTLPLVVMAGWELQVRPRTLIAIGLAASASFPRAGVAALIGVASVSLFWVVSVVLLLISTLSVVTLLGMFRLPTEWMRDYTNLAVVTLVFSLLLFAAVFGALLLLDTFVHRMALFRLAVAVAERDANA